MTDIKKIRACFPQLNIKVKGQRWTYLDSAATTLKPHAVIDRLCSFYTNEVSNVHRGAHFISDQATSNYENARKLLSQFVNADNEREIIFTKGTTDSINLVAESFCEKYLKPGDEIILSQMEHHSNIVPWQKACKKHKAHIKYIPITDEKELNFEAFQKLLNKNTKLVALSYVSNALGTKNPIKKFFDEAKKYKAFTLVDAAQAASLFSINVSQLNCDFLALSSHKLFGPFGVGILYGKEKLLNSLSTYQTGGSMVDQVTETETSFLNSPFRFEAGTPNIGGIIGFGEAIQFFNQFNIEEIRQHEKNLMNQITEGIEKIDSVKILSHKKSLNILSVVVDNIHPSDLGQILDEQGVAVRTGHHCAQPLMKQIKQSGTLRASLSIYNNDKDVDYFLTAFKKAINILV